MFREVDTKDPAAVEAEVQIIYTTLFPSADPGFVPEAFRWTLDCFEGRYPGYNAIDVRYHDVEHTMQGTLCMVRLLEGYHSAHAVPFLSLRMFQLGLLAILLHDTGYLKKREDSVGTGAKYTLVHVSRSIDFAAHLLSEKKFPPNDILAVQNMIRCTGVNVDLTAIPFQNELERIMGYALGTADLLGQMAAADYVEKLPILYGEFAESQLSTVLIGNERIVFSSARDLMLQTPDFWNKYVRQRIEHDFLGLYRCLNCPGPDGRNVYLERIEANIEKLQRELGVAPA